MESVVLGIFGVALICCVATGLPVICALIVGLVCFSVYAHKQGHDAKAIGKMLIEGILRAKVVLSILLLIGMLTASWRASGTIAYILYYAADAIDPSYFTLFTFLICTLMSVLTGTSFGTAGTAGVVCMSIAQYMGLSPLLTGGAVISGIFVGDRCSPMSSSALLVASITDTDIWTNIKIMLKTSWPPFLLTCAFYALAGRSEHIAAGVNYSGDFWASFLLSPWLLLPAAVIAIMCLLQVKLWITISVNILLASALCFSLQDMKIPAIIRALLLGYEGGAGNLMNGGGAISMLNVLIIVVLSSSYFGIFGNTPLLDGVKAAVARAAQRFRPFTITAVLSVLISAISCNQTLATMLTQEMQREIVPEPLRQAEYLENSVILIAALIPWSIAGAVPAATIGAPITALVFAVYLYAVPIWNIIVKR